MDGQERIEFLDIIEDTNFKVDYLVAHMEVHELESLFEGAKRLQDTLDYEFDVVSSLHVKAMIKDTMLSVLHAMTVLKSALKFKHCGFQICLN